MNNIRITEILQKRRIKLKTLEFKRRILDGKIQSLEHEIKMLEAKRETNFARGALLRHKDNPKGED